ncbi:MAG: 3'-5' exonuclease [bacterium]
MNDYTYIDTNAAFGDYLKDLKNRGVWEVALDIEGEFNLHVYGERFCLLQLFDGEREVAVDPLAVSRDLLKQLLEDRNLLKITYDCAGDRLLLAKSHGILMSSILDLRPAVELLGYPKQDLGSILEDVVGIRAESSKKRFQQYNWTRRPIDPAAIEYAVQDVRHLFALKEALLQRLAEAGRMEQYILENLKRQDREPDTTRKAGVLRSGRFKRLSRNRQREFERIYEIRDRYARELDLPPDTVLANKDIFALVTDEISLGGIRSNRRVPREKIEALKDEIAQGGAK